MNLKELNRFLICGKEVIFRLRKCEQLIVTEVSESISMYGYSPDDFTCGKIRIPEIIFQDDLKSFDPHSNAENEIRIYSKSGEIFCALFTFFHESEEKDYFWLKIKDITEKKRNEEDLTKCNKCAVRRLFERSTEGMTLVDENGFVKAWNNGCERLSGISGDFAVGKPIWEIVKHFLVDTKNEDKCTKIENEFRQLVEEMPEKSVFREIVNSKSGKKRLTNSRYFPVVTSSGRTRLGIITHDITELENIRLRQAILINILQIAQTENTLPQTMCLSLSEIGEYTGVSRVYIYEKNIDDATASIACEWCKEGVEPVIDKMQNISSHDMQKLFENPDSNDTSSYIITSNVKTHSSKIIRSLHHRGVKSVLMIPLICSGVNCGFVGLEDCESHRGWEQTEISLLLSVSQIISATTRRYRVETEIRRSEEMYRRLTIASPDAIVNCSPSGRFIFASPKVYTLFDIDKKANINDMRVLEFVHPHNHRQAIEIYERLKTHDVVFISDFTLKRCNDTEFIGEISAAAVRDDDGLLISIIMVIRDITRRKMDELELIMAKQKAEESDNLKTAFLANVSHEIRTPLNAISGFLNIVKQEKMSADTLQECIEHIDSNCSSLLRLIEDIIDVSKIEVKQMELHLNEVHINGFMDELKIYFYTSLQNKGKEHIRLIFDDGGFKGSSVIKIDATRLRQTLESLLDNAIKFTEKGHIRFGYRQSSSDMLEFVVEDTGIGICPNKLDVIFDSFRQAELGNNRRHGGAGLGLTISRGLVKLMGGDMWVKSAVGEGASFFFTIPYSPVKK